MEWGSHYSARRILLIAVQSVPCVRASVPNALMPLCQRSILEPVGPEDKVAFTRWNSNRRPRLAAKGNSVVEATVCS